MKTTATNNLNIPWWYTELGAPEIKEINKAINNKKLNRLIIYRFFSLYHQLYILKKIGNGIGYT